MKQNSCAFSAPMRPLEACESVTRREKMTPSKRQPYSSIVDFNMVDSRNALMQSASLPRTASHIYTLQKGCYGSTAGLTNVTAADTTMAKPDFIKSTDFN